MHDILNYTCNRFREYIFWLFWGLAGTWGARRSLPIRGVCMIAFVTTDGIGVQRVAGGVLNLGTYRNIGDGFPLRGDNRGFRRRTRELVCCIRPIAGGACCMGRPAASAVCCDRRPAGAPGVAAGSGKDREVDCHQDDIFGEGASQGSLIRGGQSRACGRGKGTNGLGPVDWTARFGSAKSDSFPNVGPAAQLIRESPWALAW
jgi:hypothetical protein